MIAEELKLVIKAEVENAVSNLKRFSSSADDARTRSAHLQDRLMQFGKSLLAAGGIIFGFHQLANAIKSSIIEYQKQETAEAKLRAAIKATGNEGLISAKSIGRLASELQRTTTFADDVTISAAAMLQQLANLDERRLKDLIPRVQNLAAAMNMDLVSAATLVGKTIGTTTNALSRYIGELDLSGSKSDKTAKLIQALDAKFAGMAETLGTTAAGQIIRFQNALGDLKEVVGEVFVRGIGPMIEGIIPTLQRMNDAMGGIRFSKSILTNAGMAEAISSLPKAKDAIEALNEEIKRTEGLLKTQGRYRGTEEARIKLLKDRLTMIQQVLPLLEKQSKVEADNIEQAKKIAAAEDARAAAVERAVMMYRHLAGNIASMENRNDAAIASQHGIEQATINVANALALENRYFENNKKAVKEAAKEIENYEESARRAVDAIRPFSDAIGMMSQDAEKGWEMFKEAAKDAIAAVLEMLAKEAFVRALAAAATLNFPAAAAWTAAGLAAMVGAGVVRAMAEGGIVTKPTHALIGEAGPEAVIPLNKMGSMGGLTVVFNGTVIDGERAVRKIGAMLDWQRRGW